MKQPRHISSLMQELGFNKDAPIGAQKAFIKNLIKAANRSIPSSNQTVAIKDQKRKAAVHEAEQMSFNFSYEDEVQKKVS